MDNDRINYSDLVSPDDSIKNLIDQLTELNKTYGAAMDAIKTGAKDIISQLKAMSTATTEGRNHIDEAAQSANRLTRAQKELRFAMSDVGKEVAWLKSQTASHNRMSVEARKESLALIGSYDKLKAQLKDQIRLWKSLSETERNESFGKTLLSGIMNTKKQLADLDGQLRIHVQSLSAVEKAEQKLNFLRSAEGKRLMELKRLINEELLTNKANARALDEVTQAQIRYNQAQTAARQQAHELNILAHEANRVSKLQAQLNLSAAGSYNRLAAQYELNKIKLNAMSAAERSGTEAGKLLEKQTLELYVQMQKLQEATGNHRLSVGNYAKSWDGLGMSVSQVVRELPSAAVSINTLFLALSNNIPILVDEINALRETNKKAVAEGKPTKSVMGGIVKALFSWQTALVIGMTLLASHGREIVNWVAQLIMGKKESLRFSQALENVNKEIANTNAGFGNNVTTFKKLAREWSNLRDSSAAKRNQWIKDSKEEFDKLEISINGVNDAENVFVQNTKAMLDAFKFRAKAAAAIKLATDKYEQAFVKEAELESEKRKNASFSDQLLGAFASTNFQSPTNYQYSAQDARNMAKATEAARKKRLLGIKAEMEALNKEGDLYFSIYELQKKLEEKTLEGAGIESAHKKTGRERHPRLIDLTDIIWRNDLSIRKKYEISLSELQRDEFKKRRIEAIDQTNQTIRAMQDKFRKNEVYLANPEGKYKPLTPKLKAMIENQQKEIASIIENTQRRLEIDLVNLQYELEIDKNRKLRQVMNWHLEDVADNIEKEKQMRLAQVAEEESMYTTKGSTVDGEVVITSTATPEQTAAFQRKKQQIIAEYDQIIYEMRARDIEAQLELVRKGSEEELALLEKQNEIAMQLALTQNRAKPIEERQDEGDIIASYGKKHKQAVGAWKMDNLEAKQNQMLAEYEAEKHNAYNVALYKLKLEKQFWAERIKLAEEGAIDVSEDELDAWRANQKKREREYKEQSSFMNLVGQEGLSGAIFTKLDWDEDKIKAADAFTEAVVSNLKAIADAEVEVAEAAVAAAEKRVEAAQTAYEAEVEGRNNGYANSVATAKKELQQEKKNQQQKQKLLEEAQRRQQAIDTLTQTSSLITASAQLWSSFSGLGPAGPALAIAAIAAMWGSFAVAKVKAAQVTKASQEYGEGGLEFLEGGSHASGNDIDLHTTNSKGKNMRAEGGEAMAIINRRNTRKYRKVLPRIVDSINKGTFEDKFMGAFKTGDDLSQNITYQSQAIDLSRLEEDVRVLKDNSERQYYAMPDGSYIEKRRNVIRRIH